MNTNTNLQALVDAANTRLRAARAGCTIQLRGSTARLWIRGTFPDKRGIKPPYQQRIALKQYATPQTIKEAEQLCKLIGLELNRGTFDWRKFSDGRSSETVGDWVKRFEVDRWSKMAKNHQSLTTWSNGYLPHFEGLPQDVTLSVQLLKTELDKTPPDSAYRLKKAVAFIALAKFAGLDYEPLKAMKGRYSASSVDERELPSDDQIEEIMNWLECRSPAWAWVFGTLSTYGIRPHEIFYLDWREFPVLRITGGKTGERISVPLHPQWAERWELNKPIWPRWKIEATTNNGALGRRINGGFRTLGITLEPYDLRHAWAGRSHQYGLSDETAAKFMGHSPEVHRQTYKRWIGDSSYLKEYQQAIQRFEA